MSTAPFPHTYRIRVAGRDAATSTGSLDAEGAPTVTCGPPPQFGGQDTWWSPENLLLGAVGSCHMTTFLALARHKGMEVDGLTCEVEAKLDKTREGLRFTSLVVDLSLEMAKPECDGVQRLVEKTHQHCIVTNALSVPVEVRATIRCSSGEVLTVAA